MSLLHLENVVFVFCEGCFPVGLVEMLRYWIPDLSVNSMCIL